MRRIAKWNWVNQIVESLRKSSCTHFEQNYYMLSYYDAVLKEIGNVTDIDFSKKYRTLSESKKLQTTAKKLKNTTANMQIFKVRNHCSRLDYGLFPSCLLQNKR